MLVVVVPSLVVSSSCARYCVFMTRDMLCIMAQENLICPSHPTQQQKFLQDSSLDFSGRGREEEEGGTGRRGPCSIINCFKIEVSIFSGGRRREEEGGHSKKQLFQDYSFKFFGEGREGRGTWFIHFRQLRKSDCPDCRN